VAGTILACLPCNNPLFSDPAFTAFYQKLDEMHLPEKYVGSG
jgi:hypothetical protein